MSYPNGHWPGTFAVIDALQTTHKLMMAVGAGGALSTAAIMLHPHWKKVNEAGHMDVLDDECVEVLGLSEQDRAHVDNWDNDQKDRVRSLFCRMTPYGMPLTFRWRLGKRKQKTHITGNEVDAIIVTFEQPVDDVKAEAAGLSE